MSAGNTTFRLRKKSPQENNEISYWKAGIMSLLLVGQTPPELVFWVSFLFRHGFTYIRGWMQMVLAPNDLFSWNNNTMSYILVMHNDTYSVHDRSLKPWWSRLPCLQPFCYVFSSPLSELNWRLTSPLGARGPHPQNGVPSPGIPAYSLCRVRNNSIAKKYLLSH